MILIIMAPFLMPLASLAQATTRRQPYPIATTQSNIVQEAQNAGFTNHVEMIMRRMQDAADTITFNRPLGQDFADQTPNPAENDWFTRLINLLIRLVKFILAPIAQGAVTFVITLVHNPNIASPFSRTYTMPGYQASVPYDLVSNPVKLEVRKGFIVMQALAINLLLLLFILAIWNYWTQAALRNGQNLMGVVGRLIVTTGLILFWPVISFHFVQISNEMIDFVFRSIRADQLAEATDRVIEAAIHGGMGMLGGQAVRLLGNGAAFAAISRAVTGVFGGILSFIFLTVLIYEAVYLIVLKAVQTGLMIAQFMFAPMFLVFFATPSTENVATGYIKSCVEVCLWTFVWAGLLKILIIVLSVPSEQSAWGQFIMLLGVLQIMLHVPEFMGRAQISPMSDFMNPRGISNGMHALKDLLKTSGYQMGKHWFGNTNETKLGALGGSGSSSEGLDLNTGGDRNGGGADGSKSKKPKPKNPTPAATNPASLDTAANAAAHSATSNAAGGGAGNTAGNPTAGAPALSPPTGQSAAKKKKGSNPFEKKKPGGKPLEDALSALHDDKRFGTSEGDDTSVDHDGERGVTGLTFGKNLSPEQRARAFLVAALANELMRNPAMRKALAASLGWSPNEFRSGTMQEQRDEFNKAINKAAVKGAEAYLSGKKGNTGTGLLKQAHGEMTPEKEEEALAGLQDDSLPNSVFNPNYGRNKQAVEGAGLPVNAATMAMAGSTEGSKLRGPALAAAYNALAASLAPNLPAGLTPGTTAYNNALGRAIAGTTPDKQRAAAAVGIGLMNTAEADALTDEQWAAYINETEGTAKTLGIRPEAAVALLGGMANTQAGIAHGQAGASLPDRLKTAAQALAGMNENRVPKQAWGSEAFASHMYELAKTGNLTPQKVFGALKVAQVLGENFTEADSALAETMLNPDQAVGGWAAGDINGFNMALVRAVSGAGGVGSKRVCERVLAAGMGIDDMTVSAANRSELNGMNPARAGMAVRSMINGIEADSNMQAYREGGHDANALGVSMINAMPASSVLGYASLPPGVSYTPEVIGEAVALEAGGYGRTADMAGRVHRAMMTARAGGGYLSAQTASVGLQNVIDGGFAKGAWEEPGILATSAGFSDAQLANGDFMAAAKHGVNTLPQYTVPHIDHLSGVASAAGIPVGQIGRTSYEAVLEAVPLGSDLSTITNRQQIHGIVLSQTAADTVGLLAGTQERAVFMQNAGLMQSHADFSALSGPTLASGVSIASGWAVEMVAQGGGTVDGHLTGMNAETRRTIVAIAERGGDEMKALSGGALVDCISTVGTVARELGLRDHGQAVELVEKGSMVDGSFDPGRVQRVLIAEKTLSAAGASREARQDVQLVSVVADLASDPANSGRLVELAGAAVNAREVFQGANYNPANVTKLANYTRDGGWTGAMSLTEYEVVDKHVAPAGVAPTRQLVQRIIQFQSANPGVQVTTEHVNVLVNPDASRVSPSALGAASGLLASYASACLDPAGTATISNADLHQQLRSMSADDVRTVVTIQAGGGTNLKGQQLLNLVAVVNDAGGAALTPQMLQAVVNLNPAVLGRANAGAVVARAVQLTPSAAELGNTTEWLDFMSNDAGFNLNQITAGQINACRQVNAISVGPNEPIVPTRNLIERLMEAKIDPATQPDYVVVAAKPEMAGLRDSVLRDACSGVLQYFNAGRGPAFPNPNEARWTELNQLGSNTIRSCIAIQQTLGAAQCADITFVDHVDYNSSLNATNSGAPVHVNVRQGNAQFPIDYP